MTAALALLAALLAAPPSCDDPVPAYGRETACEVRELTLPARGSLAVVNDVSGGVTVAGWDRDEVSVRAVVRAYETDGRSPGALLAATRIETDGAVRNVTDGAVRNVTEGGGWVEVRYEVRVPRATDLSVRTNNGALTVEDVRGTLRLDTSNGPVRLARVGGDVEARTSNGDVTVTLGGAGWSGDGLRASTRNGDIRLVAPEGTDAVVEAATRYGAIGERMPGFRPAAETSRLYLGAGGPTLALTTSYGDVRVVRS